MVRLFTRFFETPSGALFLVLSLSTVVFALFYPTHFLIADEAVYFEQASTWVQGHVFSLQRFPCDPAVVEQLPGAYPAGTGLLAALFIWAGGPKAVFWSSFTCWMLGAWVVGLVLRQLGKPVAWALYPWLFFPALILSRTLMSDMPSFALAAVFAFFTVHPKPTGLTTFAAGLTGGFSLLFRETNLIWVLPFAIGGFLRQAPFLWNWWVGFAGGVSFRFLSAWLFMQDPFFYKNPGIGFSFHSLPQNSVLYFLLLLLVLPGGFWFLWKSHWIYRREIWAVVLLFLVVYGSYGYDALAKSGYKGLVLQGRFLLPLLPFFALSAAHCPGWFQEFSTRFYRGLMAGILILFCGVQAAGNWYNQEQARITGVLYAVPTDKHLSFTPDESQKFINGLYGPKKVFSGSGIRLEQLGCDSVWYAHAITRRESVDRKIKSAGTQVELHQVFGAMLPPPIGEVYLIDGTHFQVWKITR